MYWMILLTIIIFIVTNAFVKDDMLGVDKLFKNLIATIINLISWIIYLL